MTLMLTIAIFLSAALTIAAHYTKRVQWYYILKPLTTALIILLVFFNQSPGTHTYKYLILSGLIFSLAGDIFLMLPKDRFISGLVSFLIAHILYIIAFAPGIVLPMQWWPGFFVLVFLIILLRLILSGAANLKIPVVVYAIIIGGLLWIATERMLNLGTFSALQAAVGAALFVASDSALAIRRFIRDFPASEGIILATYYAAQLLIALSV
ncbi:MAG: lysoplasmalogenase [Candidatus Marinimicrobia bacterium]|nr:lysoplasmalogenase [Candidatus Neomarinimicrobiota bacterium]